MRSAGRLLDTGLALAAVAIVLQSASHLAFIALGSDPDLNALNADHDFHVWAWASTVATFGAAFAALVLAVVAPEAGRLAVLAVLLAFFSLDDMVMVHEKAGIRIADQLGLSDSYIRAAWVAVYLPLLALSLLLLLNAGRRGPARAGIFIRLGLGLLVAAVGAEALSTAWFEAGYLEGSWPDRIEVIFEEDAELGGWILIASGLAAIMAEALGRPYGSPDMGEPDT